MYWVMPVPAGMKDHWRKRNIPNGHSGIATKDQIFPGALAKSPRCQVGNKNKNCPAHCIKDTNSAKRIPRFSLPVGSAKDAMKSEDSHDNDTDGS
mmetsp:Transcript_78557/g.136310  ORF Transcript_78557/g.136310 Transcript_78557/m.136310 type:complete len:95 (-) Transcript_78557:884-1168(-)